MSLKYSYLFQNKAYSLSQINSPTFNFSKEKTADNDGSHFTLNDESVRRKMFELAANMSLLVESTKHGGDNYICFTLSAFNRTKSTTHTVLVSDSGDTVCFSEWVGLEEVISERRQCVWKSSTSIGNLIPITLDVEDLKHCFIRVLHYFISRKLFEQPASDIDILQICFILNIVQFDPWEHHFFDDLQTIWWLGLGFWDEE